MSVLNKTKIMQIATRHGAFNVRLFGSMARGEETKDSDVDMLVDMESGRSLFDLMMLKEELEEELGRRVDVVTEKSLNRHIKDKILLEAITL